jgi:hypothetical protein
MSAKPRRRCIENLPFFFSPQEQKPKSAVFSTIYILHVTSSPSPGHHHGTLSYTKTKEGTEAMTSNKNTAAARATATVAVLVLVAATLLATVANARPCLDGVLPPSTTSHGVVGDLLPRKIIPPSGPSDFWSPDDEPSPPPPAEATVDRGN